MKLAKNDCGLIGAFCASIDTPSLYQRLDVRQLRFSHDDRRCSCAIRGHKLDTFASVAKDPTV
ncbi:hypothetical protein D3C85_1784650 [compost metagenome]